MLDISGKEPTIIMNKEFITKFKNICSVFLRVLAGNPLQAIVILFLIVLALGALVFYRYDVLIKLSEPKIINGTLQFQKEAYEQILGEWQAREDRITTISSSYYIDPFQQSDRRALNTGPKKLSEERTQELLSNPQIQELMKASNLYQFYTTQEEVFLTIDERAKIWQELELGQEIEYSGTYNQNIKLLSELKRELTE